MGNKTNTQTERIFETMNAKVVFIGKAHKWGQQTNRYGLTVHFGREFATFDFFQGLGIKTAPTAEEILKVLFWESTGVSDFKADTTEGFLSWCDEYGFKADFESLATFKEVHENTTKLEKLFGANFNVLWDYFNELEG